MTAADVLALLDGVRSCGAGRWSARCPAHDDRSPSLSVSQGARGILLWCWAGCTLAEIVAALGIRVRALHYDADAPADSRARREAAQRRDREQARRAAETMADGAVMDACREAEWLVLAARGLDLSGWSDAQLAAALDALADAYAILDWERREDYAHA